MAAERHFHQPAGTPFTPASRRGSIATPLISASAPTANTTSAAARLCHEAIPSQSGLHDIHPGDPLPDTLSGFLSGSPFVYTVAIAPPYFSNGEHIGPAAINRSNYSLWIQDTWKMTPRFTLDYGLRYEVYTPITERAKRTGGFLDVNGQQQYVVNPQPGYSTNWNGFGPRVQAAWQVTSKLQAHAGGAVTVIPPNIWQDNFLTGSTPFVVYPRAGRRHAARPFNMGSRSRRRSCPSSTRLPATTSSQPDNPKTVAPNTMMDVDRYEKDMAALTAEAM